MLTLFALVATLVQPAPAQKSALQMMTYQMVLLRDGPNTAQSPDAEKIQLAHLDYLAKLNRERINLLYGPFLDEGDLRGLAVLDVPDADAARKLFAEDPHVKAGNLVVEVRPWMGPRGWFQPPADTDVTHPEALERLIFGFLVRGPAPALSESEGQRLQKEHLAYMDALHKEGKLIMAGPFLEDTAWRGVVVYRVATVEEAKQLAAGDPLVKVGRLVIDARPWMTLKGILR